MTAIAAGCALADDAAPPRLVRTGIGLEPLAIQSPEALLSDATRINIDRRTKAGLVPAPIQGYRLTHRVIVRDAGGLATWLAARPEASASSMAGAPGFTLIEAANVLGAVQLADELASTPGIAEAYVDLARPRVLRDLPSDPSFPQQWHLRNLLRPGADANVIPAWDLGYTGTGVVIGIIDAGNAQNGHGDLSPRYLPQASITAGFFSAHATAVAGVAVSAAGNGYGGVGSAYGAQYGTMPQGSTSQNAAAFGHRNDIIHIKNNSWGPFDNATVTKMPSAEYLALQTAVTAGRNGKGVIFVWAAGNGGTIDRVDYDPYASSRYVIPVGAIDDDDDAAAYNELGSSMLVVAPSDGSSQNRGIFTTDLLGSSGYTSGDFTSGFGGTSAAAPLASGVIALMLQANPNLSWRDVQRILVETARNCDPTDNTWVFNGAGYPISYAYGFGAIDAGAAVVAAQTWTPLPPETMYDTGVITMNVTLPDNATKGAVSLIEIPGGISIETVELVMNASGTFIGDLHIMVRSPGGTTSVLAKSRPDPGTAYADQIFTSRRCLGEDSGGIWSIQVSDRAAEDIHTWSNYRLVIRGTRAPCAGDLSGSTDPNAAEYGEPDGAIDGADFFYFLDQFTMGNLARADLTGSTLPTDAGYGVPDGQIDASDFFYFLDLFEAGCL